MSRHPVTPMHEADLRRHLGTLGLPRVGLVDLRALDAAADEPECLDAAVVQALAAEPAALLFDTTHGRHLHTVGRWLWQCAAQRPQLLLGASGVAQAALAHWPGALDAEPSIGPVMAAPSPVFLLIGSLSPVTAAQVQHAAGAYDVVSVDPVRLLNDNAALDALTQACSASLARGRSVLARTTAPAAGGPTPLDVARIGGALLARVLARNPQVRRVGVAGGDTSSLALGALRAWALGWSGTLAPGVALMRLHAGDPALDGLELMLKGGQMGPPDLFMRLLQGTR